MIFDEVTFHNFGVYRNRQTFNLTPKEPGRPITLIGALNGSGKTTFVNGIQLALYGKRANIAGADSGAYETILRKSIHKNARLSDGAAIELALRRSVDGKKEHLKLNRTWVLRKVGVRESFEVIRNGKKDELLTEHWSEFVESILPQKIAPLFFFDGEKIETLADFKNSGEIVRTALYGLLGLDLVENLLTDLRSYETRISKTHANDETSKQVEAIEVELSTVDEKLHVARQRSAHVQSELDRAIAKHEKTLEEFRRNGGPLYDEREKLHAQIGDLELKLEREKEALRELASGPLPLLMLREQISTSISLGQEEHKRAVARKIGDTLKERDNRLLKKLESTADEKTVAECIRFLADDRATWEKRAEGQNALDVEQQTLAKASSLLDQISELQKRTEAALSQYEATAKKLLELERKIHAIPASSKIKPIIKALKSQEDDIAKIESDLSDAKSAEENLRWQIRDKRRQVAKLYEKATENALSEADSVRILRHSNRARTALQQFKNQIIEARLDQIEALITDCYRHLIRKKNFICAVKIDRSNFAIRLFDADEKEIETTRLSAGERQLLATALLWAFAKASGQAIPTIIDTPLGRLDSYHRRALIKSYFPYASHQVILLSTDEEIGPQEHANLSPAVSREYLLEFDPKTQGTQIIDGYFGKEMRHAS